MIVGPGVLGPDDLGGDAEGAVEVLGLRFGGCGLADAQHGPVVGWQDNGADLMALEGVAHGWPGGVDAVVEECLLDRDQQMVGEHAEEDVGFGAVLGLMEDRACGERRFHVAEGVLGAGEQGVDAPQFVA